MDGSQCQDDDVDFLHWDRVVSMREEQQQEVQTMQKHPRMEILLACRAKDFVVLYLSNDTLLIRTIEDDGIPRLWTIQWFQIYGDFSKTIENEITTNPDASKSVADQDFEIVAMALDPQAQFLGCITVSNQFHLLPIQKYVQQCRKEQVHCQLRKANDEDRNGVSMRNQKSRRPNTENLVEDMLLEPSRLNVSLMSFLSDANSDEFSLFRAKMAAEVNVNPLDSILSLKLFVGFGLPTCCVWWNAFDGKLYFLVGSSKGLISFIDVQANQEKCRCELTGSGSIYRIDLVRESFRKENRTSLLVHTSNEQYFRVVVETKKHKKKAEDGSESVIKTFPDHYEESEEFQPKRINRFSHDCKLFAFTGPTKKETSIGVFNPSRRLFSVYSNFNWPLHSECGLPNDGLMIFCSHELIMMQHGDTIRSYSRPSRQYLSPHLKFQDAFLLDVQKLHDSEAPVQFVLSSCDERKTTLETHLSFYVCTRRCMYDASSKWTTLRLFKQLFQRSLSIQMAFAVGCALRIHVPSFFELVANGICEKAPISTKDGEWILSLFEASNIAPSVAVRRLVQAGGVQSALAYSCQILRHIQQNQTGFREDERTRLAHLVLHGIQHFLSMNNHNRGTKRESKTNDEKKGSGNKDENDKQEDIVYDVDLFAKSMMAAFITKEGGDGSIAVDIDSVGSNWSEEMIHYFILTNQDYETEYAMSLFLRLKYFHLSLLIARTRSCFHIFFRVMSMQSMLCIPESILQICLEAEVMEMFETMILEEEFHMFFHAISDKTIQLQILLLLADNQTDGKIVLYKFRDWLIIHCLHFEKTILTEVLKRIDPRYEIRHIENTILQDNPAAVTNVVKEDDNSTLSIFNPIKIWRIGSWKVLGRRSGLKNAEYEADKHLTVDQSSLSENPCLSDRFSCFGIPVRMEEIFELFLSLLLVLNYPCSVCDDSPYSQQNFLKMLRLWAGKYRASVMILRCHDYENWSAAAVIYEVHGECVDALECRLRIFGATSKSSSSGDRIQEDMIELLNSLVIKCDKTSGMDMKTSVLARWLLQWKACKLDIGFLETFLTKEDHFGIVAPCLCRIMFPDHENPPPTDASENPLYQEVCDSIQFSGNFYRLLCEYEVLHPATTRGGVLARAHLPLPQLHAMVVENLTTNIAEIDHVVFDSTGHYQTESSPSTFRSSPGTPTSPTSPTSPTTSLTSRCSALDPLETHVVVFTCGHSFPQRVFVHEVLPLFDQKMTALSATSAMELHGCKQVLLQEYRSLRDITSACPLCAFEYLRNEAGRRAGGGLG